MNLLLKRGQQEYVFPTQVARVMGNEVGLKLMPLTTQQHIDFVQCTFARADTWALWQDSYPEDKPLESLLALFRNIKSLAAEYEYSSPARRLLRLRCTPSCAGFADALQDARCFPTAQSSR